MPCQEERLLPGPGSQCWLVAGCPGYRRVLCLSLSHLLEWRGEQWHLASLPQGHCPLQAHSAVWQESRQGWLVALVGREQEGDVRTVLSMLLQSHSQRHGGPARLSLEEGDACRLCSLPGRTVGWPVSWCTVAPVSMGALGPGSTWLQPCNTWPWAGGAGPGPSWLVLPSPGGGGGLQAVLPVWLQPGPPPGHLK